MLQEQLRERRGACRPVTKKEAGKRFLIADSHPLKLCQEAGRLNRRRRDKAASRQAAQRTTSVVVGGLVSRGAKSDRTEQKDCEQDIRLCRHAPATDHNPSLRLTWLFAHCQARFSRLRF